MSITTLAAGFAPMTEPAAADTHQIELERTVEFILAGNATFTLVSEKTGARFTYKARRADGDKADRPWFVSVLTGPDNEGDFSYLGCLFPESTVNGVIPAGYGRPARSCHTGAGFVQTKKSAIDRDAPSARAFRWFWDRANRAELQGLPLAVYHEGRCGRCGRKLTVPESILTGFGPECAGKLGL